MKAPSLKKDSLISLLTSVAPSLIGLIAIPLIIKNLGLEKFAFLGLVWALTGYFGIFDLGLGRSLSKRTALRHGNKEYEILAKEIQFGLLIVFGLSILVSAVLFATGTTLISKYLNTSAGFTPEAHLALLAMIPSLPFVMITTTTKGIFEGLHSFKEANWIQIITGLSNFLVPLFVSFVEPNLFWILIILSIIRGFICIGSLILMYRKVPFRIQKHWDFSIITDGGWLTISALSSPIMIYVDRFVLSTAIPLKELAFYTVPVDLVGRLWIVPQAVTRVSFPTFSYYQNNFAEIQKAFRQSLEMMIFFCLPGFLFMYFFAGEILHYWISPEMESHGSITLQILVLGLYWNCLGWVPYSFLQATDGAQVTAIISLVEIPIYILSLIWASHNWGYLGAACVWAVRLILDTLVIDLYLLVFKSHLKELTLKKILSSLLFTALCLISTGTQWLGTKYRIGWGILLFICLGIFLWKNKNIILNYKKAD